MSWHDTRQELPEVDRLVEVPNNGGAHLRLHQRGFWLLPDRLMYVYYTPQYWRYVD
jgi:hypothetical protein